MGSLFQTTLLGQDRFFFFLTKSKNGYGHENENKFFNENKNINKKKKKNTDIGYVCSCTPYQGETRLNRDDTHTRGGFSLLDCSTTKMVPIPNDTSSESSPRDASNADVVGVDTVATVEIINHGKTAQGCVIYCTQYTVVSGTRSPGLVSCFSLDLSRYHISAVVASL